MVMRSFMPPRIDYLWKKGSLFKRPRPRGELAARQLCNFPLALLPRQTSADTEKCPFLFSDTKSFTVWKPSYTRTLRTCLNSSICLLKLLDWSQKIAIPKDAGKR
jgi:hypothetical protein